MKGCIQKWQEKVHGGVLYPVTRNELAMMLEISEIRAALSAKPDITTEEYEYLLKRDAQLEYALDMVPNLEDVLEQFEYEEE